MSRSLPDAVSAAYGAYPAPQRKALLGLREIILDVGEAMPGVGPVEEVLRWGQPSFVTPRTRAASTVRIDAVKGSTERYALYFICHTGLVDRFKELYPAEFTYEGNRALVFTVGETLPKAALRHCIGMALTYHLGK